jgi:hypothetical protein
MTNHTLDLPRLRRRAPVPPAVASDEALLADVYRQALLDPSTEPEKLRLLGDLQQARLAHTAKAAYAAALIELQRALPIIAEAGRIRDEKGAVQYSYALWEDTNEAIRPVLAAHGFALSFRTGREGQQITVTGVLSHRLGHSEQTTMQLPTDVTGAKNPVQAIGSSTSYGRRYVAMALLNLSSRGEDDDGQAANPAPTIDERRQAQIRALAIKEKADLKRLLAYFKITRLEDLPVSRGAEALRLLRQRGARR